MVIGRLQWWRWWTGCLKLKAGYFCSGTRVWTGVTSEVTHACPWDEECSRWAPWRCHDLRWPGYSEPPRVGPAESVGRAAVKRSPLVKGLQSIPWARAPPQPPRPPSSQFYISIAKPWPTQTIWWWGRGPNPGSIPGRSTYDMCWTLLNLSIHFSETLARVSSPSYILFVKPRMRGASPPLRLYTCKRTASNSNFH